jgi:serpin B
LEEKLKNQNIQDLFKKQSYETKLNIQLPKFKLDRKLDLRMSLIGLGMSDMFSAGSADFSGINGKRGLFVSEVVQKALIEVNEEGSEAAAATAVGMSFRSTGGPKLFLANHPFIFYIRDKTTGMLLFQGRVVNPNR